MAKSRVRRSKLLAILGVPRLLLAISKAPVSSIGVLTMQFGWVLAETVLVSILLKFILNKLKDYSESVTKNFYAGKI
jgi:hypothetical protein